MELLKMQWIALIYPLLCAFVPCIIYQIFAIKTNRTISKVYRGHLVWTYIFILYIWMVFQTVGIGNIWDIGKYGEVIRTEEINLLPFQSQSLFANIMNIVMFMPLGFLLPMIWAKYRRLVPTVVTGAVFSLTIEFGQLFNRRASDVDDLMMNALGTLLGFLIWKAFAALFHRKNTPDRSLTRYEAVIYLGLALLGRFFLFNPRYFLALLYY